MASIYDVDPSELIEKTAIELKKIDTITPPKWASFIKTGVHKERPPMRDDWWYVRAASILRKVYILGTVGVEKLRTKYGGKRDRGYKPEHFFKGSGNIIRKMFQQLQKAELIKFVEKGVHKGRSITPKGIKLLELVATEIYTRTKPSQASEVALTKKDVPAKRGSAAKITKNE